MKKLLLISTLILSGVSFSAVTGDSATQALKADCNKNCSGPGAEREAGTAGCNKGQEIQLGPDGQPIGVGTTNEG